MTLKTDTERVLTARLIARAGTLRALARLLDVSTQAIHQWGEHAPAARVDQLRKLRPEWFR